MIEVVKSSLFYATLLSGKLRYSDLQEIEASTGKAPMEILQKSWQLSEYNRSILKDNSLVALFGVAGTVDGSGVPWMLGTDALMDRDVGIYVARNSRKYRDEMLSIYPKLFNYVDARNELSIKWLKWCGFTLSEPVPYGVLGLPFHYFELER